MEEKFLSDINNFRDKDDNQLSVEQFKKILNNKSNGYLKHKRPNREKISEIVKNSVISIAIGDALGVPFEFKSRVDCKRINNGKMIGYMSHNMPKGTWSDDTSMTLATIDEINKYHIVDTDLLTEYFCDWIFNASNTAYNYVFDYGRTTYEALNKYEYDFNIEKVGSTDINSNGNGSLMRMLPISLYTYFNRCSWEETKEIVDKASSITHAHDISKCACFIYTIFVHYLMDGYTKETAYYLLKNFDFNKYYSQETLNIFDRILKNDITKLEENDIKSSGYVVDTLEASIWSIMKNNNYKDTLVNAVNLGEDTDTIGAITGSMAGIIYNSIDIPLDWKNDLIKYQEIMDKADIFAHTLKHLNDLDYDVNGRSK